MKKFLILISATLLIFFSACTKEETIPSYECFEGTTASTAILPDPVEGLAATTEFVIDGMEPATVTTTSIKNDVESGYTEGLFSFGLNGWTTDTQLFREFPGIPIFDILYRINGDGKKEAFGIRAWSSGSDCWGCDGSGNGELIVEESVQTIQITRNNLRLDGARTMCVKIVITK